MLAIQKNLTKTFFAILSLPSTAMGFALSVQIAALSWILSVKYGFEIHEIGIVWAAGPLAGIIAQPIVGAISDKLWFWGGRRRPFILIGGVLAALMLMALPNIDIIGKALGQEGATIGIAIAVALTLDLSINVSFNPTRSIIADVTPEGKIRTRGYTWMQTISGSFGVLAYFVGASMGNYFLIYSGAALVLLFSIIPPFLISEPRDLEAKEKEHVKLEEDTTVAKEGKAGIREFLDSLMPLWGFLIYGIYIILSKFLHFGSADAIVEYAALLMTGGLGAFIIVKSMATEIDKLEFQKILLAHAFTWLGIQTMFVYMFAYARSVILQQPEGVELSTPQSDQLGRIISYSFLILNAVGAILPATILEPLTKRIGRVRTHMISIFIMAAGYAGIFFLGKTTVLIYILMAVVGIGWASTISLSFAIMSERVNQTKMGLYMGIFNLSVVLPQLVASFKMGEVIGNMDDKAGVFLICFISLAISALLWIFVRESKGGMGSQEAPAGGAH
jgi:MFS family permease